MACHDFIKAIVALLIVTNILETAGAIVNSKIDRIIDLSSQLVKIVDRIHLEGNSNTYTVLVDSRHLDKLAYIDATLNGEPIDLVKKSGDSYEANLAGKTLSQPLVVTSVYSKILEPYPVEITQNERQLVRFVGTQAPISAYLTKTATTKIKLPQSSRLESFTKASKMTTGSNKLTYGPFKDVQANQSESLTIHFENNTPFIAVTSLERIIEVSPWGRVIHFANDVKIAHVGAKLKGSFSRFDYQRSHMSGMSSVKSLSAILPKTVKDVSFRDSIGIISTSTVRATTTKTLVELKPRFPLFGGWVTDFKLGYIGPLDDFLNQPVAGNNHRLSIAFADVLYENMFIDEATTKIVLPAGSSNVEVIYPVDYERLPDKVDYSYLDVIGRPVVVLSKKNVVPQHLDGKPLVIRFDYNRMYMLQEPILLIMALIGLIVIKAIYSCMSDTGSSGSNKVKRD